MGAPRTKTPAVEGSVGVGVSKIVEIMDELGAKLDAAYQGITPTIQVSATPLANPTGLAIDIWPGFPSTGTETQAFGDIQGELIFSVRARSHLVDFDATMELLIALMDEEDDLCIAHALSDDQTLNGMASSVDVAAPGGIIPYANLFTGSNEHFGTEWRTTVVRSHS